MTCESTETSSTQLPYNTDTQRSLKNIINKVLSALMTQTVRFQIKGMHCAACVTRVEAALRKLPSVSDVVVNLATNEARVVCAAETTPDYAAALQAIGYQVAPIEDAAARGRASDAASSRISWNQLFDLFWPIGPTLVMVLLSVFEDAVPHATWGMLALATVVMVGASREFFVNAARSLRHASLDMDVLVAIGSGTAFVAGAWSAFSSSQHAEHQSTSTDIDAAACGSHLMAAVLIVVFVRIGRTFEARARRKASDAIGRLLDLQAPSAHVLRTSNDLLASEVEVELPVDQVVIGDTVLVRAGERIPVDGVVLAGVTEVDESSFTGESLPVRKQPGDRVLGGAVNHSGSFRFRAEHVGDEMALRRIAALVRDAQGSKAPIARLADRVAGVFVPIVLAIATITFAVWLNRADLNTAISRTVAVLVVACPCALGLATPTAVMVAMGKGAEFGVLFKDGAALEQTATLQIALFDKTGTLTEGRPEIVEAIPADGVSRTELLRVAATIAAGSNHPLARAVVALAEQEAIALNAIPENVFSEPGLGLKADVGGETVLLGNWRWLVGPRRAASHYYRDIGDQQERATCQEDQPWTARRRPSATR